MTPDAVKHGAAGDDAEALDLIARLDGAMRIRSICCQRDQSRFPSNINLIGRTTMPQTWMLVHTIPASTLRMGGIAGHAPHNRPPLECQEKTAYFLTYENYSYIGS